MQIQLRFDDAGHESVAVDAVAPGRLRLLDTPLLAPEPVYAGDVVEVEALSDGTHRFVRVADRARMRHHAWLVPRGFVGSAGYRAFGAAVEAAGGRWEGVLGGVLHAHVPEGSAFDAEAELDRQLGAPCADA